MNNREHSTESFRLKHPPCRFSETAGISNVKCTRSVQALNDWAIDGEASTLKCSTIGPSDQAVLHEGENLELFTYLSPEPLVDRILGPFEQLCIPVRAVIERDGWDSAQDVVRSEAVSQIGRKPLPQWIVARARLGSVGADENTLDRTSEPVTVAKQQFFHQRSESVVFNGRSQWNACVH